MASGRFIKISKNFNWLEHIRSCSMLR